MADTTSRAESAGTVRTALVKIIARSATFEERAAGEWVVSEPSPEHERIAICRAVGMAPNALRVRGPIAALLARARVRDRRVLPDWVTALELLLRDPTPTSPDDDVPGADDAGEARGFAIAFSGFLRTAGAWLDDAICASSISVTPAARSGLLAWLCRSLVYQARFVLHHELRASESGSPREYALSQLASRDGWLTLLTTYPVLARLLGTQFALWQRECVQLLHRVADDWSALAETGAPGLRDVTALTLKRPPTGGPPLEVTLPSGRRVVYHGKDLRMAAWFAELVSALARDGLTPILEPRAIIAREDHAWAEYVSARPCADRAEAARYFTRIGMYLRLFQALRATDMHGRNVIVSAEHPVFIDVETVLQPLRGEHRGSPVELAARARYEASPLAVGLLPMWLVGEPGYRAINVGGLNRGGHLRFPNGESQAPKYVAPTLPRLGDTLAAMGEQLPLILDGYRSMSAALATSERVRELVARARDLRVKVLWRSGFLHKRIADQSLAPLLLSDGRLRDAFLTRLMLGLQSDEARTLALHELWAIRDGAAPVFESRPDREAVYPPDGSEVAGVFAAPALEQLELVRPPLDEERDIDAIGSAIGLEAEACGDAPPVFSVRASTAAVGPSSCTPLDHAVALADFILGEAVMAGDEMLWLGASWCPTAGVRRLGALPLDLLSGSAGIAVMFAYLYRRSGASRYREAAIHALAPIARDVRAAVTRGRARCGAFIGAGGQLYALRRCATLLGDIELSELSQHCLADLTRTAVSLGSPRDVIMGAAGLLLVVANVFDGSARPVSLEHVAAQLREPAAQSRGLYVDGTRWLAGLPDEREGLAWALARWNPSATSLCDLSEYASPLTRLACATPSATRNLIESIMAGELCGSLPDLVLTLAARDASADHALTEHARRVADAIVTRRRETGRWLDDPYVADRYHLSAISGMSALALAFARIDAPELRCCARLVY